MDPLGNRGYTREGIRQWSLYDVAGGAVHATQLAPTHGPVALPLRVHPVAARWAPVDTVNVEQTPGQLARGMSLIFCTGHIQ